ncbi:hypothetical protein LSCM1_03194 [Leishmania martiniquensis]|uniref:Zinc finger protein kinase-like n=1 Tax=Leishmania martiniquensis TaxID=1580590 RepID=A0A836KIT1_9TRYP|nr:hypothetical protein LSCM1_03194 [Leishmania martiniquensis]
MSRSPLQVLYSLLRRPHSARSAEASSGAHASGEGSAATPPAGPSEGCTNTSGANALIPGGAAVATASSHSNGGAAPAVANGADRRAFEGEERLLDHSHAPRQYPLDPEKDAEVLVLLAQQFSITSVIITHYRVKESYVEYVIECVRGHDAWRVYRRYQQFKALDHDLKQLCSGRHGSCHGAYGVVPVLPGSHWMDVTNQSPELVEQRRRYLEIYLQQLLVPKNLFYVARTPLYDFLHDGEVPTHVKLSGIQPLLGLMSTYTAVASDDGDDEAILRAQLETQSRQQPQPLNASEEAAAAVPGIASTAPPPSPSSGGTFPAASDDGAGDTGTAVTLRFPEVPDSGESDAKRQEGTIAEAMATPPMPGDAAVSVVSMERLPSLTTGRAYAAARITDAAVVGEASAGRDTSGVKVQPTYASDPSDTNDVRLAKKYAHKLVCGAVFATVDPMQMDFPDERLPPASANCAQCNAEFTSFLYPRRCFFCLYQFCSACLEKLSVLESPWALGRALVTSVDSADSAPEMPQETTPPSADANAGGRTVPACRRCAENYSRRLDRCGTAPGGGAYRGMQSTLGTPAQPGPLTSSDRSSPPAPVVGSLPATNMRGCVGEESSSMMLQKRAANSVSVTPRPRLSSPRGYLGGPGSTLSPVDFHDFRLLTVIGRGTFGKVLKVQMRATQQVYAMKIMNKATVYRRCMTSYMKEEKAILTSIRPHPYIVRCHYAFQTEYYLVFVIDYLPGGELYDYIYPTLSLSPEAARIYAAELVLALEYLHRQDVVHRDLKPENVVLAADGHICLTDFGLARRAFSRSRRRSFVGSPEYVAPETIQGQVQTAAVDWWSFGVMLYEMLAGRTPFHARNNNTVYENVLHKELELPVLSADGAAAASTVQPVIAEGAPKFRGFSPEAVSLLRALLARDPSLRLQDANVIKRHPFFRGLSWDDLRHRRVPAPCVPGDMRDNDVRHFKREFVSEWASVPPLTGMTRTSIEALTKCFDNFPVSRTAASKVSAALEDAGTAAASAALGSLSPAPRSPPQAQGSARVLSLSLMLPPSVLSTGGTAPREPVRFFHSMAAAQQSFHGMWRVLSIEVHAVDDGRVIYPWGGDVSGVLVYSNGGRFSLQLTPNTRRPIGPVQRVTQLSKEDLCDTYSSYVASFGSFHLFPSSADDGCGVVRHFAEGNLCPNLMLTNIVFQYHMQTEPLHRPATKDDQKNRGSRRPGSATSPNLATMSSTRTPSTTDAEDSSDGGGGSHRHASEEGSPGASEGEEDEKERARERTTIFGDEDQQQGRDTASPSAQSPSSPPAPERRILLRLSTRPQRAPEQDFLAFTSLVFEKMS